MKDTIHFSFAPGRLVSVQIAIYRILAIVQFSWLFEKKAVIACVMANRALLGECEIQ